MNKEINTPQQNFVLQTFMLSYIINKLLHSASVKQTKVLSPFTSKDFHLCSISFLFNLDWDCPVTVCVSNTIQLCASDNKERKQELH